MGAGALRMSQAGGGAGGGSSSPQAARTVSRASVIGASPQGGETLGHWRRTGSTIRRRQQWLIFHHESVKGMAQLVKEQMGADAVLSRLEWKRFDDGFPNLQIDKEDVSRLEQFFGTCLILSLHSPEVIFEQLCLMHELPRMRAKNFHVILPWFCTGTMERVEKLGQIATAKSLADMLSCCPLGLGGPATLVTYDIHWLQEQFYFTDRLLIELRTAVPLGMEVLRRAKLASPGEELVVAFPDDGAHKKMKDVFADYPVVICDKVRDGDRRIVTFREGEALVPGAHVVVIDDMVMSGALMLECAQQLRSKGASKVSCFTVHAVMPKKAYSKFLGNDLLHRFWITDTVPSTASEVSGHAPFEVVSIAPLIAQYLLRGNTAIDEESG